MTQNIAIYRQHNQICTLHLNRIRSNNSHPCQTAAIPITNHKRSLDTNLAGSDPTYHFNKKKWVRRLFFAAKPENSKPSEYSIDVGNKDIKCTINAFVICDCKLPLNSNKMFHKQCVAMQNSMNHPG